MLSHITKIQDFKNYILHIDHINKISLGNSLLYDMCNPKNPWNDREILADKIWLIGRSYAASPERRFTWKKGIKKFNYSHGDSTGLYFKHIADYITKNCDHKAFSKKYARLNTPYRFDKSGNDLEKIKLSIEIIENLNELIKEASKDFDNTHNPALRNNVVYKNQISFCSKFLHFHFPESIFIFDSFTFDSGKLLCGKSYKRKAILKNKNIIIDDIIKSELTKHKTVVKISLKNEDMQNYVKHCLNSYMLCCFIKNDLKIKLSVNYPRISDKIFQSITSN